MQGPFPASASSLGSIHQGLPAGWHDGRIALVAERAGHRRVHAAVVFGRLVRMPFTDPAGIKAACARRASGSHAADCSVHVV